MSNYYRRLIKGFLAIVISPYMAGKFMVLVMILILIEVQAADDHHDHFIIGRGRDYIPGPFYYCLTKIESCGNPRNRWLPMLRNIANEICIIRSYSSCMSRLPIVHDQAYPAAQRCLRYCSELTDKEGRHYAPCLLRCYQERIKLLQY
jgi:hypothetical protein